MTSSICGKLQPCLLLRPTPKRDQCRCDYLLQLCEDNCISGVRQLAECFKTTGLEMENESWGWLTSLISGDKNYKGKARLCKRTHSIYYTRICVACLKIGSHQHGSFSRALSIFCNFHDVFLAESCHRCGAELSRRRSRSKCACGFDLRDTPVIVAPKWKNDFYDFVAPWYIDPQLEAPTRAIEDALAYQLRFVFSQGRSSHRKSDHRLSAALCSQGQSSLTFDESEFSSGLEMLLSRMTLVAIRSRFGTAHLPQIPYTRISRQVVEAHLRGRDQVRSKTRSGGLKRGRKNVPN